MGINPANQVGSDISAVPKLPFRRPREVRSRRDEKGTSGRQVPAKSRLPRFASELTTSGSTLGGPFPCCRSKRSQGLGERYEDALLLHGRTVDPGGPRDLRLAPTTFVAMVRDVRAVVDSGVTPTVSAWTWQWVECVVLRISAVGGVSPVEGASCPVAIYPLGTISI